MKTPIEQMEFLLASYRRAEGAGNINTFKSRLDELYLDGSIDKKAYDAMKVLLEEDKEPINIVEAINLKPAAKTPIATRPAKTQSIVDPCGISTRTRRVTSSC